MDFTPDNEQKALRDAVHDLLKRTTPSDAIGAAEHDTAQWQQFVEMGLVALPFEEGAGPVEVMLVAEELGRARVRSPYVDVLLAGHVLAQTGRTISWRRSGTARHSSYPLSTSRAGPGARRPDDRVVRGRASPGTRTRCPTPRSPPTSW